MHVPDFERLVDAPRWFADRTPEAPATWFEGRTMTYRELDGAADEFARALVSTGVRTGDRVAVVSTARPEFLVALLGIQRAGAIYVGVNPGYTAREMLHVLTDSAPVLLLSTALVAGRPADEVFTDVIRGVPSITACHRLDDGPGTALLRERASLDGPADEVSPLPDPAPSDAAAIVYTSGSTGTPKGALLPHCALAYGALVDARAMLDALQPGEVPRVPCNLPINHIGCVVDVVGCTLVRGGMVAFVEGFDPGELLALIESLRLTNLQHVPTVLQMVAAHPAFTTTDLSSLRVVAWGGAALPIDVVRTYRRLGVHLSTVYGQTETIANITYSRPGDTDEMLATTVGRPNPDALVRLVDDLGHDVPDGDEGEVLYRHPAQFLGYFRNPEATARTLTDDGSIRTGDVGVRDGDGNIRLVGRRSDMFKSGGLNVYPREIELQLEEHPAIALAAVVGRPDPTFGEVGAAFVMTHRDTTVAVDDLAAWCRGRLAGFKVPKSFEICDELPLLPLGKVDKSALRTRARNADPSPG